MYSTGLSNEKLPAGEFTIRITICVWLYRKLERHCCRFVKIGGGAGGFKNKNFTIAFTKTGGGMHVPLVHIPLTPMRITKLSIHESSTNFKNIPLHIYLLYNV